MVLESTFGISLTDTTGKGKLLLLAVHRLSLTYQIDMIENNKQLRTKNRNKDGKINLRKTPSQLGLGQASKEESDSSKLCSMAALTIFLVTLSSDSNDFKSSTTSGE